MQHDPELIFLTIVIIVFLFFSFSFYKTKSIEKKYKLYISRNNGVIENSVSPSSFIPDMSIAYSWISKESKLDWVGHLKDHGHNIYVFLPVTFIYGQWNFISTCIVYCSENLNKKNYTIIKNVNGGSWSHLHRSLASRRSQIISFSESKQVISGDPQTDQLLQKLFSSYKNVAVDVYSGNLVIFFSGKILNNILKIDDVANIVDFLKKL